MRGNFERCLAETLRHEGGWSDHPADPGGATMRGITLATYRQYRPGATRHDLRAISDTDLRMIYRAGYWDKVRGDDLPAGLDLVAFDAAVNSGPGRGARWLQRALGVAADGVVGPATISAARRGNSRHVIRTACEDRLRWLQSLRTWPTFGRGWAARVAAVETAALAMVEAPGSPEPAPVGGAGAPRLCNPQPVPETEMIAPVSRIVARYLASALVTYGIIAHPEAATIEPDLALVVGAALGALTEGVYAIARRSGWTT